MRVISLPSRTVAQCVLFVEKDFAVPMTSGKSHFLDPTFAMEVKKENFPRKSLFGFTLFFDCI